MVVVVGVGVGGGGGGGQRYGSPSSVLFTDLRQCACPLVIFASLLNHEKLLMM